MLDCVPGERELAVPPAPNQAQAASLCLLGECDFRLAFEKFQRGLVLIDGGLRILHANAGARRIFARRDAVHEEAGGLVFRSRDVVRKVTGFIAGQADGVGAAPGAGIALALGRRTGAAPYLARIYTLSPVDHSASGEPAAPLPLVMLMMIFDPDGSRMVSPAVLSELYGLTRTEAQLAARLFSGLALDEAAAAMRVKLSTVRSHLKSIFRKCNVETQAQLLQLIALGPR